MAGAEDALSEALIAVLTVWPRDGVPRHPEACLLTAARHSLIDFMRHQQVVLAGEPTLLRMSGSNCYSCVLTQQLIQRCTHRLCLQTVLGLDAARIAGAFLTPPNQHQEHFGRLL